MTSNSLSSYSLLYKPIPDKFINSIVVDELMLEVTRRCNMKCAHCLRGEAQRLDMDLNTIWKIVNMSDCIGHITFTGGEPTLNIGAIKFFFELAKAKYGHIPPFYVATNGKVKSLQLLNVLAAGYPFVEQGDNEYCGVSISTDIFHEITDEHNPLRSLKFYSDIKEHKDPYDDRWIMPRGRAKENGIGVLHRATAKKLCIDDIWELNEKNMFSIETLYVSANENIAADCDLSYDTMDEHPLCTVDTLPQHLAETAMARR